MVVYERLRAFSSKFTEVGDDLTGVVPLEWMRDDLRRGVLSAISTRLL